MTDALTAARAQPRLLIVCDVDSTFIQQEVIELIAAYAGSQDAVAAVTAAAMRGELDFAESLRARVATLEGLPVEVLERVRDLVSLTPGARELLAWVRERGHAFGLVSGGFIEVVGPLAAACGITHVQANRLGVAGGRLTGRVDGPIIDRAAKARALREYAATEGLPLAATVAVGDGANDLDMMALAGLGVAFDAKPLVVDQADVAITTGRLDTLVTLLEPAHP